MPRKSTSGRRSVELAVTHFLSEFARHLLAAGLSYSQFIALARIAFFRAAAEGATFRNRRINYSAVAAMTGLTRVQVREIAKRGSEAQGKRDRLARIIEGWTTDASFLKSDFSPRRLRIGTTPSGFADLVRKYGGDIPPRATLREMIRNRYVVVRGQYVQLDLNVHETKARGRLRLLSDSLASLVSGSLLNAEPPSSMRSLNYEVTYSGTSARGRILLQKKSAERLRAFLTELQAAGAAAAVESPPNRRQRGLVTRTRVVLISEELESQGRD